MKWTQKELEELYQKANEKAISDPEFRKAVLADAKSALTELAGRELPEGFSLELVESDNSYASAYLAPNFTGDEIDLSELQPVAGGNTDASDDSHYIVGLSFALIISVCGAAVSVGPCGGDVCGGAACGGDVCGGNVCGGNTCGGAACGGAACGGDTCGGAGCGGAGCGGAACGGDTCGGAGCGGAGCGGAACGGNTCGGAACGGNTCGGAACRGNTCASNK